MKSPARSLAALLVLSVVVLPAAVLAGARSSGHQGGRGPQGHHAAGRSPGSSPGHGEPASRSGFQGGRGGGPGFNGGFHGHGAGAAFQGGFPASGGFRPPGVFDGHKQHHGRFVPPFSDRFTHRHRFFPSFPSSVVFYTPPFYYSTPPVVNSAPVVYSAPTIYSAPSVTYYTQPAAAPEPAVAPMPTVVEFATGRYELRGDGVNAAYTWVWIPNPPSAPPAVTPAPSDGPPANSPPAKSAPREGKIYRWIDEQDTMFWTDSLEKIPESHRSRARESGVPGGDPS